MKLKKILEIEGFYKFRTLNGYNAKVLKSYKVFFNDSLKVRSEDAYTNQKCSDESTNN